MTDHRPPTAARTGARFAAGADRVLGRSGSRQWPPGAWRGGSPSSEGPVGRARLAVDLAGGLIGAPAALVVGGVVVVFTLQQARGAVRRAQGHQLGLVAGREEAEGAPATACLADEGAEVARPGGGHGDADPLVDCRQ